MPLIARNPAGPTPDSRTIILSKGVRCIVDKDFYEKYGHLNWRLRFSNTLPYAVHRKIINGHTIETKMHRLVAKTPEGYVCHHKNRDTLDNRRANLANLTPEQHQYVHRFEL